MDFKNLQQLLEITALQHPTSGLIFCPSKAASFKVTYGDLLQRARSSSIALTLAPGFRKRKAPVLYLSNQLEILLWFWAGLFADAIVVIAPPFSHIEEQRLRTIQSIDDLLDHPLWITDSKHLDEFLGQSDLHLITSETLSSWLVPPTSLSQSFWKSRNYEGDAMFMLTSGSTGAPKAVRLQHQQILSAIRGKLSMRDLPPDKPFLNWIGLDHVASIAEMHLTAILQGVDLVLVDAVSVISDPLLFVHLLDQYQVSRTFAPNFFLAKLVEVFKTYTQESSQPQFRFDHLCWLGSGGEANDVKVCEIVSDFLVMHGASRDVIVPGFGMTETCAGCIFNLSCPQYDVEHEASLASVGSCMPGVEMRVSMVAQLEDDGQEELRTYGDLEVHGPVVFKGYYNNASATADAFTPDGWFRTGDKALIDGEGKLHLMGRTKETMIINGVKYFPQDLENILAQALDGKALRIVCFSFRPPSCSTEQICILYVLAPQGEMLSSIVKSHDKIVQTVMLHTGIRPHVISLQDEIPLQVSSLGKVSRSKMRTMLQNGALTEQSDLHETMVREYRSHTLDTKVNDDERLLLIDFAQVLNLSTSALGPETPIFEAGVTSMEIIRLKKHIETRLEIEIPVATLLTHPSARSLAKALRKTENPPIDHEKQTIQEETVDYDPVVTLREQDRGVPLWLVHPGVGEVLVFLGLSKHIDGRPIYALRARGFEGQPYFTSIEETVRMYYAAIKSRQSAGPYAIAGYSYGAMIAFELVKLLEEHDGPRCVQFFGSFNLPPHIKMRMRQLDWTECVLHLGYFLDLFTQITAERLSIELKERDLSPADLFTHILAHADQGRLAALSLTHDGLQNWASLAYNMQHMASDYEPTGRALCVDVFVADPLRAVCDTRSEWMKTYLEPWKDFSREPPRFHQVSGAHYTMLNAEYVQSFARILDSALKARGL